MTHPAVKRSVREKRQRIKAMTRAELVRYHETPMPEWMKKQNWAWWYAAQKKS